MKKKESVNVPIFKTNLFKIVNSFTLVFSHRRQDVRLADRLLCRSVETRRERVGERIKQKSKMGGREGGTRSVGPTSFGLPIVCQIPNELCYKSIGWPMRQLANQCNKDSGRLGLVRMA